MQTKKKTIILILVIIAVILATLAAVTVQFVTAKPLMLPAYIQTDTNAYIHFYTFNGMTFSLCNSYVARNYSDEDGSRISNMCNMIDCEIQQSIFEYMDESYSSYHLNAYLSQNEREKTVINFSGSGIPNYGGKSESVRVKLTVDWTKAIENSGEFIEISA